MKKYRVPYKAFVTVYVEVEAEMNLMHYTKQMKKLISNIIVVMEVATSWLELVVRS